MLVGILCRICRCLPGGPREREPSAKPAGDAVGKERTDTAPEARAEAGLAPVIIDILSALAIMAGVEMIETCVARQLASHRGSTAPGAA